MVVTGMANCYLVLFVWWYPYLLSSNFCSFTTTTLNVSSKPLFSTTGRPILHHECTLFLLELTLPSTTGTGTTLCLNSLGSASQLETLVHFLFFRISLIYVDCWVSLIERCWVLLIKYLLYPGLWGRLVRRRIIELSHWDHIHKSKRILHIGNYARQSGDLLMKWLRRLTNKSWGM